MADGWDEIADGWDDDEIVRAYAGAAFDSLIAELAERDVSLVEMRVVDFGCGTGLLSERLVESVAAIDAVDASAAMLAVLDAKVSGHSWDHVTTARTIPAGERSHDLVVCSSVCGFLDDYPGTVAQLSGLLRPGGLFVQWDWERTDDDGDDGLTRSEIHAALTAAGLVDTDVRTAFELPVGEHVMAPLLGVGRATD